MKTPLPPSITDLLNGATVPLPVEPVRLLKIPTSSPDPRQRWKDARHAERLARANRRAVRDLDIDLPF